MQPGIGTLYPRDFGPKGFERGQADNHPLAGIDHFHELDPATAGRYVPRRELETEASELLHANLMFDLPETAGLDGAPLWP